ncbi:citrate/2-methylcitrate synthase [Aeropyrum camini]|uniref:Citrate synthase n=1 Tax=Aeropyrum camini SY1 = JCM 12091 TaxID=1198449 RepID=U3TET1_9CREN|nr:citrate/2-methylcitrate synthase [Aeropyrum camini]BAN90540.1 citrate synthase [Aeropyrum camini SY1 = JCM 12091]
MSQQPECRVEGNYIVVPKGLVNVIVDETKISGVDPKGEATIYRGYTIEDIGEHASFYEAAHLILFGRLPCDEELKEIRSKIDKYRGQIPEKLFDAMKHVPVTHPMFYGIYGTALLGQYYAPEWRFDEDFLYDHALRLAAQLPVIFTTGWNLAHHGTFLRPDPSRDHAWDVLRMIIMREPSDIEARAFESTLVLYMDHGFNASTFTTRVIGSTLSDLYSAVAGGIAALKGPLHGGANEKAMEMFLDAMKKAEEKGVPLYDYIEEYIKEKLARKEKIMGFGHRIYKLHDPRTDVAAKFVAKLKDGEFWMKVLKKAEEVMWREKKIPANIDLYTAVLYYQLGIPIPMYTPIFAMGRVVGWSAHYIEQVLNNKLIRPTEKYVGPTGLKYQPIEERCRR